MSTTNEVAELTNREYQAGFVTDIESDSVPPGLSEDVIRLISQKKGEPPFLLAWRLEAYRHWLKMPVPTWANVHYPPVDFQKIVYYSAPKQKKDGPRSLDEVDPKLLETYEKLGVPLHERARLAGVAVDAVFDSVSVGTTFKEKLREVGVIFCSFSEAVQEHPELVEKYLGTRRAHHRQLLRRPQLGRVHRRRMSSSATPSRRGHGWISHPNIVLRNPSWLSALGDESTTTYAACRSRFWRRWS